VTQLSSPYGFVILICTALALTSWCYVISYCILLCQTVMVMEGGQQISYACLIKDAKCTRARLHTRYDKVLTNAPSCLPFCVAAKNLTATRRTRGMTNQKRNSKCAHACVAQTVLLLLLERRPPKIEHSVMMNS
jgi:hypothetical protein